MSGLSQLLETGLSGLSAATEAMQAIANNTANVSTPGYNVESVNQTELPGANAGPGSGTLVTSIGHGFDQFLYQQGVGAASASQAAQVVETNAQNLAALFPVASGGSGGWDRRSTAFSRLRTRLPRTRRVLRTARHSWVRPSRLRRISGP